jgi:hypothetical protein
MMTRENPAGNISKIKHKHNNLMATVLNVSLKTYKQSANMGRV